VPREGLEPSRPRGAPRFERGVSANSSHLGVVDPEGLEPSHHNGPLFLRQRCLPGSITDRECREGDSNPHAHKGASRSERGVSAIPPPRHFQSSDPRPQAIWNFCPIACGLEPAASSSARRDSNPHALKEPQTLILGCLPFHHGPMVVLCGTEESNLSPRRAAVLQTACGNHPLSRRAMSCTSPSLQ
jgi:hypothetical protein